MRYILIDTEKLLSAGLEEAYFIQEKGIALDDHEALAKFKEIWDSASESTENHTWHPEHIERPNILEDWEEFKKEL